MAKSINSKACGSALMMVLVLLQIIASGGILVKFHVTLTVENEFVTTGQKLDLRCWLNGQDLGQVSVMQFNIWVWKFDTRYLENDLFTCTFATAGKPNTTIDVYKGYYFKHEHRPCECLETGQCSWQALNEGFWCNSKFIQNWGPR